MCTRNSHTNTQFTLQAINKSNIYNGLRETCAHVVANTQVAYNILKSFNEISESCLKSSEPHRAAKYMKLLSVHQVLCVQEVAYRYSYNILRLDITGAVLESDQ